MRFPRSARPLIQLLFAGVVATTLAACRTPKGVETRVAGLEDNEPSLCAAVRGNGQYLFAHFGSLARIVEEVGVPNGISGGSSGSLTSFLYESMRLNPLVKVGGAVDEQALALLLKSLMGYLDALENSEEAMALKLLVGMAANAQSGALGNNPALGSTATAIQLQQTLSNPAVRSLINPTIYAMLLDQDDLGYVNFDYKVQEVRTSVLTLGKFDASDPRVLFREGLISYPAFVDVLGRIGDFYAARGPADMPAFTEFVNGCKGTPGTWQEVAAKTMPSGGTCGDAFGTLAKTYRAALAQDPSFANRRLDDVMGSEILAIATSAYVEGNDSVQAFEASLKRYRQGQDPAFHIDFNTVKIGYWMPAQTQTTVNTAFEGRFANDAKSQRAHIFSPGVSPKWRAALERSLMEPGLSRLMRDPSQTALHAGGWSDLHPVQVLQAAGCQDVVYVTRRGEETGFVSLPRPITEATQPHGMAELMGLTAAQQKELYTWSNEQSSYSRAVDDAGGVWCSDWDTAGPSEFKKMFELGYKAPFAAKSPALVNRYTAGQLRESVPGCRR